MHLMKLKKQTVKLQTPFRPRFASGADRIGELGKQSSHGSNGKSAYK